MANGKIAGTLTLLAGAAIGAAAGMLLAPEKGKEMRRKVYKGARQVAEKIKGRVQEGILGEEKETEKAGY